ncbi:MAG TPA: D-aminoacyl-tRNA deacylase [Planctomycetota bacterium]|jgi:D-tyrosyl-tRNA(Tyr) deacylase|nr:D-aminoacyl-tRNA deacylase [Planctomycetota bacterium]
MRAVLQRVRKAFVEVEGERTAEIGKGVVLLLAVAKSDGDDQVRYIAEKSLDLRIFPDDKHSMNRSLREVGGEVLLVSQFTLYGDARKGRRPSFDEAEAPERAREVYRQFAAYLTERGFPPREGVFGASMLVSLENDGPVTILLDSERGF